MLYKPSTQILLATSTANVGIDNSLVSSVLLLGWPRDLCTYFQQCSGVAHADGQTALYIQVRDVSSYMSIMHQIFNNGKEEQLDDDHVQSCLAGVNSAITPLRQRLGERADKLLQNKVPTRHKLSSLMQDVLKHQSGEKLLQVFCFYCLNYGDQHVCAKWFLHSGVLEQEPPTPIAWTECKTRSVICTGDWNKSLLKVDRKEVPIFLKAMINGKFPSSAHFDNVADLPWKDKSSRIEKIYRKKKIPKNNVDSLFFQLIATKMIVLSINTEGIQWDIGESVSPKDDDEFIFHYDLGEYWININTY